MWTRPGMYVDYWAEAFDTSANFELHTTDWIIGSLFGVLHTELHLHTLGHNAMGHLDYSFYFEHSTTYSLLITLQDPTYCSTTIRPRL